MIRKTLTIVLILFVVNTIYSQTQKEKHPFTKEELRKRMFTIVDKYLDGSQHPETFVIYSGKPYLSGPRKGKWMMSPEEVKAGTVNGKPRPKAFYYSGIADTALYSGHLLIAMLEAEKATKDPRLAEDCKKLFKAMKLIGSTSKVPGVIVRGPHPFDKTAYYDNVSVDQMSTYTMTMTRFYFSGLASKEDKEFIKNSLQNIGKRLEKNNWTVLREDGKTICHAGGSWLATGKYNMTAVLTAVLKSIYKVTGDKHWQDLLKRLNSENNGLRRKRLYEADWSHKHMLYSNQMSVKFNTMLMLEDDPVEKSKMQKMLTYIAEQQINAPFPSKWMKEIVFKSWNWQKIQDKLNWDCATLPGAKAAWGKFDPSFLSLKDKKLKTQAHLCHIEYPLVTCTMILLSNDNKLIDENIPFLWDVIKNTHIYYGNTGNNLTVSALLLYAHCYGK